MIKINQIRLPIFDAGTDKEKEIKLLKKKAAKLLKCRPEDIRKLKILKRSVDAREKNNILFVYTLSVRLHDSVTGPSAETERKYIEAVKNKNVLQDNKTPFTVKQIFSSDASGPDPVIVGSGPCGLFAALIMADSGLKPVILERGRSVDERLAVTELFFETGKLDPDCNIQFGEGGAGTFSDGKLNTGIKDQDGLITYVLKRFAEFGADESITYDQKPHIGTDVLLDVVRNIRKYITDKGGRYIFNARFDGLDEADGRLVAVYYTDTVSGSRKRLETSHAVLALGHSARDTYEMLNEAGICLEPKPFAIGVRVQHPQKLIDEAMYGVDDLENKESILGPSPYKLTHRAANGRNIYSFCMCPGGYVVNSSSEEGGLCINGMSYNKRDSGTANSALIVNVTPEDFKDTSVLGGIYFQRELEKKAYDLLKGVIPYETYGEFRRGVAEPAGSTAMEPEFKGFYGSADVRSILPEYVSEALIDGMEAFGRTIKGFDSDDTVIAGVETRTSSPVRILREKDGNSLSLKGLYPAGEGAGYAGGITSAAVDGIRAALNVINDMTG